MSLNSYFQKLSDNKIKNKIYKKYGLGGNFMLLAIVFIICGFIGGLKETRFVFSPTYKSTKATVLTVEQVSASRHSKNYEVLVSYSLKDNNNLLATLKTSINLSIGDEITILYKKNNTSTAIYGGKFYHLKKLIWYLIFVVGGGLIALKSKQSIDKHTQNENMKI